jgi:hypothetical protein
VRAIGVTIPVAMLIEAAHVVQEPRRWDMIGRA